MQRLSYERLTLLAALMMIAPAVVGEVVNATSLDLNDGIGRWMFVSTVVIVTASYYLVNFFIARTFQRSGHAGRWPIRIATVSAIMAVASFIPGSFGFGENYARLHEIMGDLGFIGMGFVSAYAIGFDLVKATIVKAREVWGSIALYLIVGVSFSYVYGILAQINPEAFSEFFETGMDSRPDLIYFSFVTQMSVGFGDIIPMSQLARNVVILHGLFGILYPPILIARLVNLRFSAQSD